MKAKDLSGQRFGRLVVLDLAGTDSQRRRKWSCRCDCGKARVVYQQCLLRKSAAPTRSCGCLQKDMVRKRDTTHGLSKTPEYMAWVMAKRRCAKPKSSDWDSYGQRGITIFSEWIDNFEEFYKHLGPKPSPEYSLDRINNDGHYEPGNVRWATPKEQANNRRKRQSI